MTEPSSFWSLIKGIITRYAPNSYYLVALAIGLMFAGYVVIASAVQFALLMVQHPIATIPVGLALIVAYEFITASAAKARAAEIARLRTAASDIQKKIDKNTEENDKSRAELTFITAKLVSLEKRHADAARMRSACATARHDIAIHLKAVPFDEGTFKLAQDNPLVSFNINSHLSAYSREGATEDECLRAIDGILTELEAAGY